MHIKAGHAQPVCNCPLNLAHKDVLINAEYVAGELSSLCLGSDQTSFLRKAFFNAGLRAPVEGLWIVEDKASVQ